MLQQESPEDFVISYGEQFSVRQFIIWSCEELGIEIEFKGDGLDEVGIVKSLKERGYKDLKIGQTIVEIDKRYFRPSEVDSLLGDATKAKEKLGWEPEISVKDMCREMVRHDFDIALKNKD